MAQGSLFLRLVSFGGFFVPLSPSHCSDEANWFVAAAHSHPGSFAEPFCMIKHGQCVCMIRKCVYVNFDFLY